MLLGKERKCERTHDCIHCGLMVGKGEQEIHSMGRGYHIECFGRILVTDVDDYTAEYHD